MEGRDEPEERARGTGVEVEGTGERKPHRTVYLRAVLKASSKSVVEPLRLIELPRLGVITRGSPR